MNTVATQPQLDPNVYLDNLIQEMNLQDEDPEQVEQLKDDLAYDLQGRLFEAMAENLEADVIESMVGAQITQDPWQYALNLIERSPGAKRAIADVLEAFWDETLESYELLSEGV